MLYVTMGCLFFKVTSIIFAILTGLAILAIQLWMGVAFLVPQYPFTERNIANGVVLIVLAPLSAPIGAGVAWYVTGGCCWLTCDDDKSSDSCFC